MRVIVKIENVDARTIIFTVLPQRIKSYLKNVTHISKIEYVMEFNGRGQKYRYNLVMEIYCQLHNEVR